MAGDLKDVANSICKDLGLAFIGSSGDGVFKETYHVVTRNKKNFALKVFKSGKASERTNREIGAMLTCDHPNIGKLLEVDKYEYGGQNYLYLLEEFLSGGTLSQKIREGAISFVNFHSIGISLINAVSHIASHDLVHRDIKPDNIMFRDDRITPVMVDFGLVRDLKSESLTQTWMSQGPGTPYFSAPEQLNNQKELIDWRTDQFSLGITLSLSIFGVHPFHRTGDGQDDVLTRMINRENISPSFTELCSRDGLEILIKMVSPWSVGRFRNSKELESAWDDIKI